MATFISSIVLSSGVVVDIPIFPTPVSQTLPCPYNTYSRSGGILAYWQGTTLQSSTLSAEDMLELINLLNNWNCTSLEYETISNPGRYVSPLFWSWWGSSNGMCLSMPAQKNSNTVRILATGIANQAQPRYFDGENTYNSAGYTNYYQALVQDYDDTQTLFNIVRGYNWAISIASKSLAGQGLTGRGIGKATLESNIAAYFQTHPNTQIQVYGYDPDSNTDPFIINDPSGIGGGLGDHEDPELIEKVPIPDLPTLSAVDTGLVTLYTATNAQLQSLGTYLWSSLWDVETNFKKLFASPMDCIVGLSIVPVAPPAGAAQNVKFGNITTTIALNKLSSQYVEVDCGSLSVKEYVGSFLDYAPYVKLNLFLPFIGYIDLSPDDVMKDSIHVIYHVDVLSGACVAMVETSKKGLLYSYSGSCSANVPVTAINYSGAIQNAVSAVGGGLTAAAGMATGVAPLTAVGAAQMLQSASNTALNSKPTIQRSGAMGGAAGLMGCQNPFLVITRPRMSVPDKLNKFAGLTTNVTMKLGTLKGFTQIEHIHLSGISATQEEKDELEKLLRQGVIF